MRRLLRLVAPRAGRWSLPACAMLALLAACEAPDTQQEGASAGQPADRPEERLDTVMLEGMAEPIRLRLYRSPADFPLPFSTYVPEDMRPEVLPADSGASIRFTAAFGGATNPNAYLNLYVYPEGRSVRAAASAADAFAVSRGVPVSQGEGEDEPDRPRRYDWSRAEYPFDHPGPRGERVIGLIAVGEHGGRVFHVIQQHPQEYAEGFGPRAEIILEQLRWEDTGRGLARAPTSLR